MIIGILKESEKSEKRVSISPNIAKKLITKGFEVLIEKKAGLNSSYKDSDYKEIEALIQDRESVFEKAQVLIKINPFNDKDLKLVSKRHILMSQLHHKSSPELIKAIVQKGATAFSMDAILRSPLVK